MNDTHTPENDERSWVERLTQFLSGTPQNRADLEGLLELAVNNELIDDDAKTIMEGALSVSDMQVRDIMIPRAQMTVIKIDAELDEAKALVSAATDRVAAYDSDQYDELLAQGQSVVAHGYSGNFLVQFFEAEDPDQYTYFVPEEGGTRWVDNMSVVGDAPHPCTAHAFINFLLDAENGAALTNWNHSASPNEASGPFIDQEVKDDPIVYPTDLSKLEFIEDTGDFEIKYSDAFIEAKG